MFTKYKHQGSAHVFKKVIDWSAVFWTVVFGLVVVGLLAQ